MGKGKGSKGGAQPAPTADKKSGDATKGADQKAGPKDATQKGGKKGGKK